MGNKKKTILIVEDEVITAMLLELTLKKMGFDVFNKITCGEEAVLMAEEKKPDFILMDIRLAGEIDGIEAALKILKHETTNIIFMTGYGDEEIKKRACALSPLGYFSKPLDMNKLLTLIQSVAP